MKKKIIGALIAWVLGLISFILVNNLFDKKEQPVESVEQPNTIEITTTGTTSTTTTKVAKKVVKTTKKKTITKKTTKTTKKTKKINIKYDRQEVINYTYQRVVARFGADQWDAVYNIVSHESGWNPNSWNKSSTACGLFQACPCRKTIKNGYKDYYTNWKTQVEWGLDYIKVRYKTPKNAWKHWKQHKSY